MRDKDAALEAMARDELGIDPEELGGSAWTAAQSRRFCSSSLVPSSQ
jgi:vacuolar iron transporter family protein